MPAPIAGPSGSSGGGGLRYTGHALLRHRLVLSLLSRKPARFDHIHPDDPASPGLKEHEVSFLRLLERISNGTQVEISYSGTSLRFVPGTLVGGAVSHTCPNDRAVGYFLEPLLALAPFCKKDFALTLRGVTTNALGDPSVDTLRIAALPTLALWLDGEAAGKVELRISKRGHPPGGGGECVFRCPAVKTVRAGVDFTAPGRISKIRGIAHSVRVSPQLSNRLVVAARSILNPYLPDVYIYTDVYRGDDSGRSPGFALTLLASSTSTALHSAEAVSSPLLAASSSSSSSEPSVPEDVALQAARSLLDEIFRGGCIDHGFEWLAVLFLALSGEADVGKVRIGGPLEPGFVQWLRDLKASFGVTAKITEVQRVGRADGTTTSEGQLASQYILSVIGVGFVGAKAVK